MTCTCDKIYVDRDFLTLMGLSADPQTRETIFAIRDQLRPQCTGGMVSLCTAEQWFFAASESIYLLLGVRPYKLITQDMPQGIRLTKRGQTTLLSLAAKAATGRL